MYAETTNERYRVGGSDIDGKGFNELSLLGSIKVFSCLPLLRSGSRDVVELQENGISLFIVSNNYICYIEFLNV